MTVFTEIDVLDAGFTARTTITERSPVQPARGGTPLSLKNLGKAFGERQVLHALNLDVRPGEFVAVIGRSGCGKSTLLRLLAGLETPSEGSIEGVGGSERRAAPGSLAPPRGGGHGAAVTLGANATRFMFQDARLLPWARVVDNIALGLKGDDAKDRALHALSQVGLAERANDWPAKLSGGQRQRVALARALVHSPRLLLLDEPLGALDALTRIEMQGLIERLWLRHGFTAVLVTHDVSEALTLADRVLLIEEGRIALDERVDLPRPRRRNSAFAVQEQRLLDLVLRR